MRKSNGGRLVFVYFFCVMQLVPLCAELSYDSECETCEDVDNVGVISPVAEGDPCEDTIDSVCYDGVCSGN